MAAAAAAVEIVVNGERNPKSYNIVLGAYRYGSSTRQTAVKNLQFVG